MNKPSKILCFLAFFVLLAKIAFAQHEYAVVIVGEDVEGNTCKVKTATVLLDPIGKIKDANNVSELVFENLNSGSYTVTIFSESFQTLIKNIELNSSRVDTFILNKLSVKLTEVEIAAKRKELFAIRKLRDVEGTSIFAGKKSEVVMLELIEGNLAANKSRQVYAQVAGLNIYESSDGGLQLAIGGRGLDPSRTANFNTRQNGYDISADVLGYPENYYTPPAEAISQVQVLRGASSLQYGTQFGGLINFKLKEIPSFKKIELESNQSIGSFNFLNTFNRVGVNYKKSTVNAYVNYKQGDGFRANSEFKSINTFVNYTYRFNKKSRIRAEFSYFDYLAKQAGGLTDTQFGLDPNISTRDRNWFDVNWLLYNIRYEHEFTKQDKLSFSIFHLNANRSSVGFRGNQKALNENPITSLDEQDLEGNYITPRDLITDDFFNYGAEAKYITKRELLGKKSIFLIGAKVFKSKNQSFQGAGSMGVDPDFNSYNSSFTDYPNQSNYTFPNENISLFSEQIYYLNDKFLLTPGIRYEYIKTRAIGSYNQVLYDIAGNVISENIIDENRSLPRHFVLFGLGASYRYLPSLKFNANISQNYRSVTFSDIRVTSPTYIVDPNIQDESGFTADFNVNGRFKKAISYDLGLFSIFYNNRIGIILDDRANRVRKNIGTAVTSGMESLVDINLLELVGSDKKDFKLNLFSNSAFTYSRYIASQENNVIGNRVEFIPLINLKSGLNTGYKNFLVSIQHSYLSSQFTDVQNSSSQGIGESRNGIVGEIPSYSIMDLTFSFTYKRFKVSTGLNNALNAKYFTQRATGYPGPGIIPAEPRTYFITLSYNY